MQIIAKTTGGVIIEASNSEVIAILNAVTGKNTVTDDLKIGVKIPAIDYSATISKVKALGSNNSFTSLENRLIEFVSNFKALKSSVEEAANIEI